MDSVFKNVPIDRDLCSFINLFVLPMDKNSKRHCRLPFFCLWISLFEFLVNRKHIRQQKVTKFRHQMLSINRTMMTMSEEKWQRSRRERLFEVLWSSLTRNYLKLLLSNSEEHWHATRNDSQYCNSPTPKKLKKDLQTTVKCYF